MGKPVKKRTIFPFPPEIIEHILDQFGDSLPDLKTCSLVCRDWLPRARHHLFHSISLPVEEDDLASIPTPSPQVVDTKSILDILHSSPHLIAHIQKLTLDFRYSLQLVRSSEPWLANLARVVKDLRRLVLFMFPIHDLSPKMQHALPDLLSANTLLDTIVIDSCVFEDARSFWKFLRHTNQLLNLRHLVLIGVVLKNVPSERDIKDIEQSARSVERATEGGLASMARRTKLSTLELGQMSVFPLFSAMFTHPNSLFDLTALRRVKIRDIGALFFYADLWPVVGSSITQLDFEVGKYVRDEYVEPQFMSFTVLTHLTLSVTASRLHLPNLTTILSHIHLIPSLKHLYIIWPQLRNTWDIFSDLQGCDALDSVLAGLPETIKGLRSIALEMRCHCPWQAPFEDGYEREVLARTDKTGILDLQILEISGYTMYGDPVFTK